ncbi:putative DNA-binding ribbon-helix-helix protein [Pseudochelatococcus lubricantis]|uniref:DNA-binding ribbon-helix-helix protein n=1 Tax=Pseudochelatococcus lubricantis TaxID=1538102 RepID=A0ABX0V0P5_9HYPH|nr:ribbon-helix-helix domain-containing protein [Pseudochelatococcus lubricantis]NIJ57735.1 putative DNA-binding ribbon-helix-helix protein [Pseudochelatococcus lubricantis]
MSATGVSETVIKRSVMIAGHRTSVSLEQPFWDALREIAENRQTSVAALIADIDTARGDSNLSSAIRVFVLAQFRQAAAARA